MKPIFECLAMVAIVAVMPNLALGQPADDLPRTGGTEVGEAFPGISVDVDLRLLAPARTWRPGDPIREVPRRRIPRGNRPEPVADPNWQDPLAAAARAPEGEATLELLSDHAGMGFSGANPPDTVGDVGPSHFIQGINGVGSGSDVRIYDKNGAALAAAFQLDTLGTGSCATGAGDPIILYDQAADRWMLSEFSDSGNRLCIYVSKTANPISGGWCHYQVTAPSFPDYPKYGVWSDAYYLTANESAPSIYALDRANMLISDPSCGVARPPQRFTAPDLGGFVFQALTPADLDGSNPPPPGAPGIFLRHRDDEAHGSPPSTDPDTLQLWTLDVDWDTPASSVFTGPQDIVVSEFDSTLCGLTSFSCIDQPGGGANLDPLREVVMFRLAYRNFTSHQSLIGNFATSLNAADDAGVRWFELRNTGSGWSLHQEGTWSPDLVSRWMGAIAMDGDGNIALAYNVADETTVFPGLRASGRLADAALGTFSEPELTIIAGTARNTSNRYGDYAAMGIDPADDCTFWFTGQYNTAGSWSTRFAKLRFATCGSEWSFASGFELGTTEDWSSTTP